MEEEKKEIYSFQKLLSHNNDNKKNFDGSKKNSKILFILSAPRSGSTLLRIILAGHSKLFSPQELYLMLFKNLKERSDAFKGFDRYKRNGLLRVVMDLKGKNVREANSIIRGYENKKTTTKEFYQILQRWIGDKILVDKTPAYASDIKTMKLMEEYFDNPQYIFLSRDPQGMINSYKNAYFIKYPSKCTKEEEAELVWRVYNNNIINFLNSISKSRWTHIKFENLLSNPLDTCKKLCDFLRINFSTKMINVYDGAKERMIEGVNEHSVMVGDPNFFNFKKIELSPLEQSLEYSLMNKTLKLTKRLGHKMNYLD